MNVNDTQLKNLHKVLSQHDLDVFNKLLVQYPEYFVKSELVIYLALAAKWTANVIDELYLSLDNIDVDTADAESLKKLSDLVGYTWNEALPIMTNRTRIKYYMFRKKYRGTIDSLKNLIKTGYGEEGFFSNRANNSVSITENSPQIIVTVTDNEDTTILRDNIEEVRPAGTVLRFLYRFTMGFIDMMEKEMIAWTLAHINMKPSGADLYKPLSKWYYGPDGTLGSISELPILDSSTSFRPLATVSEIPEYSYRDPKLKHDNTISELDSHNLSVGKWDVFYRMYINEHDKYLPTSKTFKDKITAINDELTTNKLSVSATNIDKHVTKIMATQVSLSDNHDYNFRLQGSNTSASYSASNTDNKLTGTSSLVDSSNIKVSNILDLVSHRLHTRVSSITSDDLRYEVVVKDGSSSYVYFYPITNTHPRPKYDDGTLSVTNDLSIKYYSSNRKLSSLELNSMIINPDGNSKYWFIALLSNTTVTKLSTSKLVIKYTVLDTEITDKGIDTAVSHVSKYNSKDLTVELTSQTDGSSLPENVILVSKVDWSGLIK